MSDNEKIYPYRIFISYSHDDEQKAGKLRKYLDSIGVIPDYDQDIDPGMSFSREIKRKISYAHIFITLLTKNSKNKPWVHQEIGYALGLRVPNLTLSLDEMPEGMSEELQSMAIDTDLNDLPQKLTPKVLNKLFLSTQTEVSALYEFADMIYKRGDTLVKEATDIYHRYEPSMIRQKAPLSSFSVPNLPVSHPNWEKIESEEKLNLEIRKLLLQERIILEKHAQKAGCKIIINPYVNYESFPAHLHQRIFSIIIFRLSVLSQFIQNMPDDKIEVAFNMTSIEGYVQIIIGNWYTSETMSQAGGKDNNQTIFTNHAPTVLSKINEFDYEFDCLIDFMDIPQGMSNKEYAMNEIDKIRQYYASLLKEKGD